MSAGASVYQMVTGLGDAFGKSYSEARRQAQEDEAPGLISNLISTYQGGGAVPGPGALPAATGPAAPASPGRLPAFAGGDASMRIPTAGGPIETRFVDALKAGGLTNPAGLAAMAAYANRESGYKPSAITGSWADPSESGQPGTSGGILSWRGDRFANMRRFTAGAEDPVVAQAKFALTENPTLTQALQSAKTAEEANSLMANAWRFAGFDRPGGELAARLGTTKSYLARLGGTPGEAVQVAQPQPAQQPQAPALASAPAPALPSFARTGGATMTMPEAPMQQAAAPAPADTGEADKPATTARPAGFMIPPGSAAAPAPTAAGPAATGFAGFASGGSRMTPELSTALTAAWRNPNTRSVATAILNQILTGKDAAWSIADLGNGRKALFDAKSARLVPLPGTGDQYVNEVDAAGNQFNTNAATGKREVLIRAPEATSDQRNFQQVLADPRFQGYLDAQRRPLTPTMVSPGQAVLPPGEYSKPSYVAPPAEKGDKYSYQNVPGIGMMALHPTDPAQSRVIVQGQPPRAMTADEAEQFGKGFYDASGTPHVPKPGVSVNIDNKGAGKFTEKANELQAKRYAEMVDAADNAVPLRADIDTMAGLAQQIGTGKLADARLGLAQYAKAAGLDSVASSLTNDKMGEMEAFTALADKLTPRMRVPGSGSTSDADGRAFKNSLPSLLKSPEGNAIIADTFRGLADYQAQVGEIAGRALRNEVSQAEADQAIRALPSPYARFKEHQGKAGASSPGPAKGADRKPPPDGYTAARILSEAKAAVAAGKDKAAIGDRLEAYGISRSRLDQ